MIRGKIMRDTNAGLGLIFVNDQQKSFTLEANWKSSSPPKVGSVVDVQLDESGEIVSAIAVDEAVIAKEQAQKALEAASEQGKKIFGQLVSKVGLPTLILVAGLGIAFLFLNTLSVQISSSQKLGISFYDILKIVNNSTGLDAISSLEYSSAGIYGFLLAIVMAAPLAPHFYPNKYLNFGYCAPIVFMIGISITVYLSIRDSVNQASGAATIFGGSQGSAMAERMISEMLAMTIKAISMGLGFYLGIAIASYLGFIGVKKYLVASV